MAEVIILRHSYRHPVDEIPVTEEEQQEIDNLAKTNFWTPAQAIFSLESLREPAIQRGEALKALIGHTLDLLPEQSTHGGNSGP